MVKANSRPRKIRTNTATFFSHPEITWSDFYQIIVLYLSICGKLPI